jgi:hypothetical protein
MGSSDPIAAERERATRVAQLMLAGQVSPRDGAAEISSPVDPAGGPASLSEEEWNLYIPFYGVLSEWESSELRRRNEDMPPDLVMTYEAELLAAARELVARTGDR